VGGVGLGIQIDEQDTFPHLGQAGGKIDGDGCFAHTSHGIHKGNDAHDKSDACSVLMTEPQESTGLMSQLGTKSGLLSTAIF
jgi:hypothetical protein